jgi:hypothetical protein
MCCPGGGAEGGEELEGAGLAQELVNECGFAVVD